MDRASQFAVCFGSSANAAPEIQAGVERFVQRGARAFSPSLILESAGHAATTHVSVERLPAKYASAMRWSMEPLPARAIS